MPRIAAGGAGFDVVADSQRAQSIIGLTGQYAAVDELLTGRENLELVGLWYHLPKQEYRRRAQAMLERLSLTDAADRQVKTYSGGMRRRLDVGASLIANPRWCSSASRPPAWTRAPVTTCGSSSGSW